MTKPEQGRADGRLSSSATSDQPTDAKPAEPEYHEDVPPVEIPGPQKYSSTQTQILDLLGSLTSTLNRVEGKLDVVNRS